MALGYTVIYGFVIGYYAMWFARLRKHNGDKSAFIFWVISLLAWMKHAHEDLPLLIK